MSLTVQKNCLNAENWQPFDRFMAHALYDPQQGYYTRARSLIGVHPSNSDFVTAPVMSPYFGQTLARQVAQCLAATKTSEIWEFGAGTGALACQLLTTLGPAVSRYNIVDLSGGLQQQQKETLSAFPEMASKVMWWQSLPDVLSGVVIGNEVLDAMPVKLLARLNNQWFERGVVRLDAPQEGCDFVYADQLTTLRPPIDIEGAHDYVTEIHPQGEAFIQTLADKLLLSQERTGRGGAVILIDYGFGEQEYYHPQRSTGTLMCHRAHQADSHPLQDVGEKDITAHVNFTGIALAAQDAGLFVNGYTSQGRFLLNCGLLEALQSASTPDKIMAQKLIQEHEMGEIFKVICLSTLEDFEPMGFVLGDRSHTL